MTENLSERIHRWLAAGEVGMSSKAMALTALGTDPTDRYGRVNYPHDPDDLLRCVKLLNLCPEVRDVAFPKLAELSLQWKGLISEWDEIVALMWEECPTGRGSAPKAYERMKRHVWPAYASNGDER
jgi:hypothetical protein